MEEIVSFYCFGRLVLHLIPPFENHAAQSHREKKYKYSENCFVIYSVTKILHNGCTTVVIAFSSFITIAGSSSIASDRRYDDYYWCFIVNLFIYSYTTDYIWFVQGLKNARTPLTSEFNLICGIVGFLVVHISYCAE